MRPYGEYRRVKQISQLICIIKDSENVILLPVQFFVVVVILFLFHSISPSIWSQCYGWILSFVTMQNFH